MASTQHQDLLLKFHDWVDNKSTAPLHGSLLKAHGLFKVETSGDSSVSGQNTIATGDQASYQAEVGKALDRAIKNQEKDKIIDILASNPGNAVTSILGLAKTRTTWNPLDPDNKKNAQGFMDFVEQILRVPYFRITQSEHPTVHYEEENYDSLINKVADLYAGITEASKEKVKKSIVNLAMACTSRVNTKNTDTLFVQNSIQSANDDIVVQLEQTYMLMERSHNTGKGAPKDKYKTQVDVKVLELTFSSALWTRDAAIKLAAKFVKSWDDWLDENTTPETSKHIKFCFGKEGAEVE